ncbi:MAG: multiprotein-bridging factor 1 family protein [Candidatus Aenigmatarchaeota archaeon]
MSECEVCGKAGAGRKAKIEGVIMTVCDKCVSMGEEIMAPVKIVFEKKQERVPEEMLISVKKDLGQIVKNRREKMGLSQEELARRLLLNVQVINRIEKGWMPPLATVDVLEKFLKASLTERVEAETIKPTKGGKKLTLGDIVEIKKKK